MNEKKFFLYFFIEIIDSFNPQATTVTCDNCDFDLKNAHQFLFSLLVTDGTGTLPLIFSDEEGVSFLCFYKTFFIKKKVGLFS